MPSIEKRLQELESQLIQEKRHNRRLLSCMSVGMAIAITATLAVMSRLPSRAVAQPAEQIPQVITAHKFVLLDENGEPRGTLAMTKNGPVLSLYDENKHARIYLGPADDALGFGLYLSDENDRVCVALENKSKNKLIASSLLMRDENGKDAIRLGHFGSVVAALNLNGWLGGIRLATAEPPGLSLTDTKGNTRINLGLLLGVPSLKLIDENGEDRVRLTETDNGCMMSLHDKDGQLRSAWGTGTSEEGPFLGLADADGNDRLMIGCGETSTSDGKKITYPESSIRLFTSEGKMIWATP